MMKVQKVSFHWIVNSVIFPMLFIIESKSMLNTKAFILVKKHAKHKCIDIKPVYVFLWDRGSTGKSDWIKAIYNVVSKTLLYNSKEAEKPEKYPGTNRNISSKLQWNNASFWSGNQTRSKVKSSSASKIFFK